MDRKLFPFTTLKPTGQADAAGETGEVVDVDHPRRLIGADHRHMGAVQQMAHRLAVLRPAGLQAQQQHRATQLMGQRRVMRCRPALGRAVLRPRCKHAVRTALQTQFSQRLIDVSFRYVQLRAVSFYARFTAQR